MSYLVDSNILSRLSQPQSQDHSFPRQAIIHLRLNTEKLFIVPQNLIEFWAVSTRPIESNGLGLTIDETQFEIRKFKRLFELIDDSPNVFANWENLVKKHSVLGKNVHDARLVAAMIEHGITDLLTFNGKDFKRFDEIVTVDPRNVT